MAKLSTVQKETMEFCIKQVQEARRCIREGKVNDSQTFNINEAAQGIVYTQGGNCTIRTLRSLEKKGFLEVLEDNSGIGTAAGAFPSKVKVLKLNYSE